MLAGVQFDLHCGIGDSGCGIRRAVSSPCRIPNSESRIPALLPQLCPQSLELALERAVDDHVAGVDDRAADQRGVDRRFDLDFAAESLAQRGLDGVERSEEHTSELQSLMRISYAVFCLKKNRKHI